MYDLFPAVYSSYRLRTLCGKSVAYSQCVNIDAASLATCHDCRVLADEGLDKREQDRQFIIDVMTKVVEYENSKIDPEIFPKRDFSEKSKIGSK